MVRITGGEPLLRFGSQDNVVAPPGLSPLVGLGRLPGHRHPPRLTLYVDGTGHQKF
jgi:hypothetical protein